MCNVRNDRRHYHHMLPCKVGHFGFWMIKACLLLWHCSSLHSEDVWLCRWVHSTGSPTFAVWEKDSPQTPHFIVPDPLLTGNIPGAMTVFFFFFFLSARKPTNAPELNVGICQHSDEIRAYTALFFLLMLLESSAVTETLAHNLNLQ